MQRTAFEDLAAWKESPDRKPLVIRGARQVGKTWLMRQFGAQCYKNVVYFNFDEDVNLSSVFEVNKDPHRIVELLSLIAGEKILPRDTLIVFDEIQECSAALNALKYFKEKANDYHVMAAGSHLGTLLAQPKSYPVGMVNLLDLYPLCFDEFLEATDPDLFAYYRSIRKNQPIEELFHRRLLEAFNHYLIIGGMPECVASWVQNKDPVLPFALQQIRAFPAAFHSKRKRVHIYTVHTDSSHNNGMGNFFAFTDLLNIVRQINRSMFHLPAGKFQFYFLSVCYRTRCPKYGSWLG